MTTSPTTPSEIESFVSNLLATHKAAFGDARMEDAVEDQASEDAAAEGEPKEDEAKKLEPAEGKKPLSAEALEKELERVRKEAAGYRTRARTAETALSEAKTPDDIAAAVAEFKDANARLERQVMVDKVARKHGLPDELAARLAGATPEEIEKDAKSLAKFIVVAGPPVLTGGLTPDDGDDGENDPRKLARRIRR